MEKEKELVYKIAEQVKFLVDEPIDALRRKVSVGDNRSGIDPDTRHRTKGDIIEEIIIEDFIEDELELAISEMK